MFERIEIWERTEDCIWIYVVFRDFRTGLFHVQQGIAVYGDGIRQARDELTRSALSETQLFHETAPSERNQGYATAEEAVKHHKAAFVDMIRETATAQ